MSRLLFRARRSYRDDFKAVRRDGRDESFRTDDGIFTVVSRSIWGAGFRVSEGLAFDAAWVAPAGVLGLACAAAGSGRHRLTAWAAVASAFFCRCKRISDSAWSQ